MIVNKGTILGRHFSEKTCQPFEVVLADDTYFVAAPVTRDGKIDPTAVELHYNCAPHTLSEQDFVLLRD